MKKERNNKGEGKAGRRIVFRREARERRGRLLSLGAKVDMLGRIYEAGEPFGGYDACVVLPRPVALGLYRSCDAVAARMEGCQAKDVAPSLEKAAYGWHGVFVRLAIDETSLWVNACSLEPREERLIQRALEEACAARREAG